MKLHAPAIALAACGLVLAGCSGDDTESAGKSPALADAEKVVLDYFEKAFVGDAAACTHESEAYAKAQNEMSGTADCAERIESVKPMLENGEPFMDIKDTKVEVTEGESGSAVATVSHGMEGFGGTYELVVKGGEWVIDGEVQDDTNAFGVEPREVSEDEAVALGKEFCQVKPGVAREDVEKWMGDPSDESIDEDGSTEVSWYVNKDSYTVWFVDGKVDSFSSSTPREDDGC